jgi:hypothetical protein
MFSLRSLRVDGNIVYITWSIGSDIPLGINTFVVDHGKIVTNVYLVCGFGPIDTRCRAKPDYRNADRRRTRAPTRPLDTQHLTLRSGYCPDSGTSVHRESPYYGSLMDVTRDELLWINAALNEVLNGSEAIQQWEFHTRIGGDRDQVRALLRRVNDQVAVLRRGAAWSAVCHGQMGASSESPAGSTSLA